MSYNLRTFHFNPVKLGQILKLLMQERNVRASHISRATDITRDTIDNILTGKVHDVKFEQLFKFCCVLEVPMTVVESLMIKDEDIDFADQIVYYDTQSGDVLPMSEVSVEQLPVSPAVVAVAEAVAAADKPPEPAPNTKTTDEYIAFLQAHIDRLTALLDKALD